MFHPKGPSFLELTQQALTSTVKGYDLLAPKFDYTPFRTPDEILQPVTEALDEIGPFTDALDVGCGTGAGLETIAPVVTGTLTGIDQSSGMLKQAEANLGALSPQPRLVLGDILEMPFESEFDLAVSFGVFGHILSQDEPRFVEQLAKVLKPGGKFVFITAEKPRLTDPVGWMSHGFNAIMRVRNFILRPSFDMYYFTFAWPEIKPLFEDRGFTIEARPLGKDRLRMAKLVIATKNETVDAIPSP